MVGIGGGGGGGGGRVCCWDETGVRGCYEDRKTGVAIRTRRGKGCCEDNKREEILLGQEEEELL